MYYVVLEDYEKNIQYTKHKTSYLHDANDFAHDFALMYVKNKEGENYENKYLDAKKRSKCLPDGYSLVKSKKSVYQKYTVMFKKSFYFSTDLKKIFKIYVVRVPISHKKTRKSIMHANWSDIFNEVLWELKDYKKNRRVSYMSRSNRILFDAVAEQIKMSVAQVE